MPFVAALALAAPIVVRDLYDPRALDPIHAEPRAQSAEVLEDHPRHRPARIDVLSYDLAVAVEPVAGTVEGAVTVRFKATEPRLSTIVLDALDMQILGVTAANGRPLETRYDGELLTIVLDGSLALGDESSVRVAYKAPMPQGMLVTGPDVTNPQRMRAAYTYTQPEEARTWFPSMDRPSDKAALTISIRVPEGYNALSNGTPVAPPGRGMAGGAARNVFAYRLDQPIATYLVSLAVGSYDVVPMGDFKGKTLTLWAPPHIHAQAVAETARTQRMMEVFSEFTGVDYPYDSYAQSVAQAYRGSMEHTTATTMGGGRITGDGSGESVVAHELAHQWFGDWVTCRTWGELWLNEGFASYLPYVFFAAEGEEARAIGQLDYFRYGYFGQAKTTVHPLSSPEPDMTNIFDSHAYEKGALTLHHLRTLAERFGAGTFTRALRTYLNERGGDKHGGTVTSHDLQAALETVTGQSWQDVFDQWVRSAGHPVLKASIEHEDGEAYLLVEQQQATRTDRRWRAFSFPLTVEMIDAKGGVSYADVEVYDDVQRIKLPISRAGLVAVNLDPRWTVPAEITLMQGAPAWREVLARSTTPTSRLVAMRALLALGEGSLAAEELALVRRDPSVYVKTDALAGLSAKPENRDAVLALHRDLAGVRDHDVATRGAIARAEEWLVKSLGRIPTREQEQEWRERFISTHTQAERTALLGMLDHASRERAQTFALARLEEAHWVTMDRRALVDILTKNPTATSAAFIEALVRDGSYLYQKQGLANLTAKAYDAPALVSALVAGATQSRYLDVRVAMIDLLAKQTSSRVAACEALVELARAGLGDVRPEALADVRQAAARAIAAHDGCVP